MSQQKQYPFAYDGFHKNNVAAAANEPKPASPNGTGRPLDQDSFEERNAAPESDWLLDPRPGQENEFPKSAE